MDDSTFADYHAYMQSNAWKKRKAQYWAKHRRVCRACKSRRDVQLHHATYARMRSELDSDLVPLCQDCHRGVHGYHRSIGGSLLVATREWLAIQKAAAEAPEEKALHTRRVRERVRNRQGYVVDKPSWLKLRE